MKTFCTHRYPDLYHYLIYTTSFNTQEEIRNYKSLDAYKYFTDGWVLETSWKLFGDVFLLMGKVNHSYAVSQTPLNPWVAIRKNGMVECGHCVLPPYPFDIKLTVPCGVMLIKYLTVLWCF